MIVPPDHLLLNRTPNIGPLISRWELDKFKNCWNKSFRTSKVLTLLHQQFSNLLISQRDMSGPILGALSNNRWPGVHCTNLHLLHLRRIYFDSKYLQWILIRSSWFYFFEFESEELKECLPFNQGGPSSKIFLYNWAPGSHQTPGYETLAMKSPVPNRPR